MAEVSEALVCNTEQKSLVQANEALKTARKLPPGPQRVDALKRAGVLRNRAILKDVVQRLYL